MKNLILIATCVASISAHALPTYEPFTEYASAIAASGSNSINLATGGYTAPGGEQWGALYFSGTAGTHLIGMDIYVTNYSDSSVFTSDALSSILPAGFPGLPAAGSSINILCVNPAQLLVSNAVSPNIVGNSAVLKFAQDITRPTSGVKTLFVSYLFSIAQKGQTGTGNVGRYLGFLASSNLNEGWLGTGPVPGAAYTNWAALFNTYGTSSTSPKYFGHGVFNGAPEYIQPPDSSAGKNPSSTPTTFSVNYNQPYLIVGEFVFTANGTATLPDTNIVWVNPAISSFGGPIAPPVGIANPMNITMSDVGGMVLIDRVGSGALGGLGTNYICNLLIGSTWSYVTGGPEFTNQPPASTAVSPGGSTSLKGSATAAGQSVSYQWVKITGGGATTNNVSNGPGGAGGSATVSGATTATLSLSGVSVGDIGNYQLVATASGTGFALNSATAALALTDPQITANPTNATASYAQSASFTATASTANAPLAYGWYSGTTPLGNGLQPNGSYAIGATGTTGGGSSFNLTLTLTNVSYRDMGSYSLRVTNSLGLFASSTAAVLAVNDPYVVTQPANPSAVSGGTATFTVVVAGSPSLTYQWYEGTTALVNGGTTVGGTGLVSGADTATLSIASASGADNGTYYCTVTGSLSGQIVNSASATLMVQEALIFVAPPKSLTERAGDHVAFAPVVLGSGPKFQWSFNGTPISGATGSALVLTNIQPASAGSYSVVVGNLLTPNRSFTNTLAVIASAVLPLGPANLIVVRVGDGAQALSLATGNTLYLDQYTPSGGYVNTIQVPDEGKGQPYGTGSSSSASMGAGSPALLAAGAGADAGYEAMLTLSGGNQEYLCFAGYCQAYPFAGADVTAEPGGNGGNSWRGLATINAYGTYAIVYTNSGLYSGGNHTIASMTTLDGTNFWTTGQAGAGTVKYVNGSSAGASYLNGSGIPSSTGVTANGGRVVQIVNGPLAGFSSVSNLVFTDALNPNFGAGLYAASGTPEPAPSGSIAFTPLLNTAGLAPGDFAFSPDNQTIYVADAGDFTTTSDQTGGGIQRFDTNSVNGGYSYSYTLQPLVASPTGAQALVVDFSASATWGPGVLGAKIYATSYAPAGNSLVKVVDTGAASSPTVLATAAPNEALRGVRFGPAIVPPSFADQPQPQTAVPGSAVTFSAPASGSGPFTYQWYFQAGGVGPFTAISGATNASYTINSVASGNVGNYYVIATNPVGLTAQSDTVALSLLNPPKFISEAYLGPSVGFQLNFTGPAGSSYTIWSSTNVNLSPVKSRWGTLTTGTFSGGTQSYTDANAGNAHQQFYIITVP
jgi:hypothetical protein